MKLSTKGRYAVMAMVDLAQREDDRPVTVSEIAERQAISLPYLEQLFGKLRRAGLVDSVRGPGGGYLLAYPAGGIRVSDVILAVDEPIRATRCDPNSARGCVRRTSRCATHDLWDQLGRQIHDYLNSVTLADVVEGRVGGDPRFTGAIAEHAVAAQ